MHTHASAIAWAQDTFSPADLGDVRRTRRLVRLAAAVATNPSGTITGLGLQPAAREGAFRLLENRKFESSKIADVVFRRTSLDCSAHANVFVPIDQTELTFTDRKRVRGLGPDSNRHGGCKRTVQVMNALALDPDGVTLGVLSQQWWCRSECRSPEPANDTRASDEKESWQWIEALGACHRQLASTCTRAKPWYLMDRGADTNSVLMWASEVDATVTIRAAQSRVIRDAKGRKRKLFEALTHQKPMGMSTISIPRTGRSAADVAHCTIRAFTKPRRIQLRTDDGQREVDMYAVMVAERHKPRHREPLKWVLLTTHPVRTEADARRVIDSYRLRWRIEEHHKAWKTGLCDVESSQLRSYEALYAWGTILAAVAARAERIKLISREQPDAPASREFTRDELDAAIIQMGTKDQQVGDELSMQEAVRLIAMIGGFMGRKADGNPGAITIGRGLARVEIFAAGLAAGRRSG